MVQAHADEQEVDNLWQHKQADLANEVLIDLHHGCALHDSVNVNVRVLLQSVPVLSDIVSPPANAKMLSHVLIRHNEVFSSSLFSRRSQPPYMVALPAKDESNLMVHEKKAVCSTPT